MSKLIRDYMNFDEDYDFSSEYEYYEIDAKCDAFISIEFDENEYDENYFDKIDGKK